MALAGGCGRMEEPPRVSFVTQLLGSETDPAISPDGKTVCFAWRNGIGAANLYSKPLEGDGGFLQLTADPEIEAAPRWSPDGRRIAYLRFADAEDQTTSVRIMDAWGGGEREVAVVRQDRNLSGTLDWTRDGEALIVGTAEEGLVRIAVRDGARTVLGLRGERPAVSPDGRSVVFQRDGGIFRASLGGRQGERKLAVEGWGQVWSADGKEILFSLAAKLWRVENATGGLLGEVALNEPRVLEVQVAPPVRNAPLVFARHSDHKAIFVFDVASQQRTRIAFGDFPDISPDGKLIVYTDGGGELWMCDGQGRDARPIHVRRREVILQPYFSSTGTHVFFIANGQDYEFALASGQVKKTDSPESRRNAASTTDGRTAVFAQLEWPGWDIRKIENYR